MLRWLRIVPFFVLAPLLLPDPVEAGACTPTATAMCLQGDRFQVTSSWSNSDGGGATLGPGLVLPFASNSSGFFRYDDSQAAELLIKVLDGCSLNNNYWVQIAVVSDYDQTITVQDLNLGNQQVYEFPEGVYSQPVIDLVSFPCSQPFSGPGPLAAPKARGEELLLNNARFQFDTTWETGDGATGNGAPTKLLERSGFFSFLSPSNPEVLVKMDSGSSGFYTVVSSSVSTLAYELTVTDLCSGEQKTYNQPISNSLTLSDTEAFPVVCPLLFGDDFETGGTLNWTSVVGGP